MYMMCSYGLPLFSLEDNSTAELIRGLQRFRTFYEPYHGYLCTVICSFGILTNLINVVVLTKRQMRTSINVLLTGIAFCDMGTMASYLIYIIHFVLADHICNPYLYTYGWMFFLMCHVMLSIALHTTTLWLSVAMAFIRNMTLRQARLGSPWLRSDNTWKICGIVYACVFALCVPSVFSNGIMPWSEYFNDTCEWEKVVKLEQSYKAYTIGVPPQNCLIFTVTFWLTGTLFKIIPCILLALLIFTLLCTIKRAEKNRQALLENRAILNLTTAALGQPHARAQRENSQARLDRTTAMLLMILGLSLLTELPQGAVSILSGIYVAHMQMFVYPNVADILDLLSLINSSVNFILYCIMSSKYRQIFWQVVLPRKFYVRWFVRPRRSARNRSRASMSRPAVSSRCCPESETLCAVSRLLARRNRRRRRSEFNESAYDDETGDNFTTNDLATGRNAAGTSPRYDQSTPVRNCRDGRDRIFSFAIDREANNRGATEETSEPWKTSPSRLRSLLLPKSSPNRCSSPSPQAAATSLSSTSRITGAKNFSEKTSSEAVLLSLRQSLPTAQCPMPTSANDHIVAPKGTGRRMFPLRMCQKRQTLKVDVAVTNSDVERKQWLVGCSCLCKCAFKSGVESSSINVVGRQPSAETVAITEERPTVPICILQKEEEHGINANEDDAQRLLSSLALGAVVDTARM